MPLPHTSRSHTQDTTTDTTPEPPARPPTGPPTPPAAEPVGTVRARVLPLAGAVAGGAALALESVVNGRLGGHTGSVSAAAWSNTLSLAVTALAAAFLTGLRPAFSALRARLRSGTLRLRHCLGGVAGGSMVLTQALTAAALGPASYTLALVSGQTLCGVLVDHLGLGPGAPRRATRRRLLGGLLAVCAVALPMLGAPGEGHTVALAALPFLAGCALSWQMAVNGKVDEAAGRHPYPAVLLSFAAGCALMVAALAVLAALSRLPRPQPGPLWHYTGGLLGCAVVLSAVLTVRRIGVLAAGLGMITGQVLGSLALGPLLGQPLAGPALAGAVLLIGAAVLAAPATGRSRTADAPPPRPDRTADGPERGGN
ncbi:DMT family transporter [Streptomyces sp. NPDC096142]|uniref:DMT family transporter n=1 Tax=Streptomyces sp. NPDC096142 TaxID=3366077 RepID=UPI003802B1F8